MRFSYFDSNWPYSNGSDPAPTCDPSTAPSGSWSRERGRDGPTHSRSRSRPP
jgi:hypothetical protein